MIKKLWVPWDVFLKLFVDFNLRFDLILIYTKQGLSKYCNWSIYRIRELLCGWAPCYSCVRFTVTKFFYPNVQFNLASYKEMVIEAKICRHFANLWLCLLIFYKCTCTYTTIHVHLHQHICTEHKLCKFDA